MNAVDRETETEYPRVYEMPYRIGEIVYHVCRDEPIKGIVVGFDIHGSRVMVGISWGNDVATKYHLACELTKEKPAP